MLHTDQVAAADRAKAKTMAYGLLYGKGVVTLANDLHCSVREAETLRKSFCASIPGVARHLALHILSLTCIIAFS